MLQFKTLPTPVTLAHTSAVPFQAALEALSTLLPVKTLPPSASFAQLLDLLVQTHLHRVYVVDADNKPLSIITLTDLLRLVSKPAAATKEVEAAADEEDEVAPDEETK